MIKNGDRPEQQGAVPVCFRKYGQIAEKQEETMRYPLRVLAAALMLVTGIVAAPNTATAGNSYFSFGFSGPGVSFRIGKSPRYYGYGAPYRYNRYRPYRYYGYQQYRSSKYRYYRRYPSRSGRPWPGYTRRGYWCTSAMCRDRF